MCGVLDDVQDLPPLWAEKLPCREFLYDAPRVRGPFARKTAWVRGPHVTDGLHGQEASRPLETCAVRFHRRRRQITDCIPVADLPWVGMFHEPPALRDRRTISRKPVDLSGAEVGPVRSNGLKKRVHASTSICPMTCVHGPVRVRKCSTEIKSLTRSP